MSGHVHTCTGPDMTCSCGYQLRVPPIVVDIQVRNRSEMLVNECFHCDDLGAAIEALQQAVLDLERI